MCGIGSITFSKKAQFGEFDLEAGITALLKELDSRGKDACGLLSMDVKGEMQVQKAACRAYEFNQGRIPVPSSTRAVAVHTRFATQGSKAFMRNNHPVGARSESGEQAWVIHNGVVDDRDTQRVQGHPEVDSFVLAMAALEEAKRGENESAGDHAVRIANRMALIQGSAAVQVAIQGLPMLVSAKINGSPLAVAEAQGVRITASTTAAVQKCAEALGVEIPTDAFTVKRKVKGEDVEVVENYYRITHASEGECFVWSGTGHSKRKFQVPEQTVKPKSWRRYFENGEVEPPSYSGTGSRYVQPRQTDSNVDWPSGGWGKLQTSSEHTVVQNRKKVIVVTRTYTTGWKTITRLDGESTTPARKFISSTSVPPPKKENERKAERTRTADSPIGTGKELYPAGTPWPPMSAEGEQFARHFLLWRRSSHGVKWAQAFPAKAKAYDQACDRMTRNKLTPPFPAPVEVEAMLKDPLFTREAANGTAVVVTDGVLNAAVEKMLRNSQANAEKEKQLANGSLFKCPVCDEYADTLRAAGDDGEMCEECERVWLWSEYQAR